MSYSNVVTENITGAEPSMRVLIIVAALLAAVLAGCSPTPLNVQINSAPGVSPQSYKTYVVMPLPDEFRPRPLTLIEKRAEKILREHLDTELTARGFEKAETVEDNPDMIATVYVAYEMQKRKSNPYRYSRVPTVNFDYDQHWLDYGVGTVVLVLADPAIKSVVWQARVDGERYLGSFEEERSISFEAIEERADEVIKAVTRELAKNE